MKELTLQEKAKAYDEAIERANSLLSDNQLVNAWIYKLLPELKESEDERIRKNCIEYIKASCLDIDELNECIVWLEKQGEQKPTWSEEDEEMLNLIIARLHSHQNVELEEYGKSHDWLKSLKDRVQPKQEWNEEGKQYLKIEGYENLSDYEKIFDDITDKYVRNKNQKGYNQSWYVKERAAEMLYHSKKELEKEESWSEEDVRNIQDIDSVLFYDKSLPEDTCMRLRNWLKSLRPQNRWKPSLSQLNALGVVVKGNSPDDIEDIVSLYNDLKKLKE